VVDKDQKPYRGAQLAFFSGDLEEVSVSKAEVAVLDWVGVEDWPWGKFRFSSYRGGGGGAFLLVVEMGVGDF